MRQFSVELANKQSLRSYLFFWSGQLFSILESSISHFAIVWWITDTTGSTMLLALFI